MMISIIVNCFNLEKYIQASIQSLLNQQCDKKFEVIVINDASTDNSLQILKQFDDDRLRIIDLPENKGAGYGVEFALTKIKGDYLCRFDGDDIWPENFLQKTSAILDQHPDVDMVYGDVSFIDGAGNITSESNNINRREKDKPVLDDEFSDILREYYINAPSIMFRLSAFEKAFPLPVVLKNFIDYYISLKVLETGKAYYLHEPIASYRIHGNNGHQQVIRNKNNELVTEFILKELVLHNKHLPGRRSLVTHNYLRLGNDYFGLRMFEDARRYYLKSFTHNPAVIFKANFLKRLAGTFVGQDTYFRTRSLLKGKLEV